MVFVVCYILLCSLQIAFLLRCCLPGELFHRFVAPAWERMQMNRPLWLPEKVLGGCVLCTVFWWVGLPLGVVAACYCGWWAVFVPSGIAFLVEHLTARFF